MENLCDDDDGGGGSNCRVQLESFLEAELLVKIWNHLNWSDPSIVRDDMEKYLDLVMRLPDKQAKNYHYDFRTFSLKLHIH